MEQFHERRVRGESPNSLGEYLVTHGVISATQLGEALLTQTRIRRHRRPPPLGKILMEARLVDEPTVLRAISALDDLAMNAMH
jgi:hypothetical protein